MHYCLCSDWTRIKKKKPRPGGGAVLPNSNRGETTFGTKVDSGDLTVEAGEGGAVTQHDPPRTWDSNGRAFLELGQRARHRLDGEAEIIGDILTRHRQIDFSRRG